MLKKIAHPKSPRSKYALKVLCASWYRSCSVLLLSLSWKVVEPEEERSVPTVIFATATGCHTQIHTRQSAEDRHRSDDRNLCSQVTIALPGSVIANAQTPELKAYLAGQLARAVAIFRADEVVVYADSPRREASRTFMPRILTLTGWPS